jgi:hypothetical protein
MSGSVYLQARIDNDPTLKRSSQTAAFGTAAVVISAKAGRLYKLRVLNKSAATKYFAQIHDKATAAVNTNVPVWEGQVAGSTDVEFDFGTAGLYLANGCSVAISTTGGVLTLAAAADAHAYALYTAKTA